MADAKLSELTAATSAAASDSMYLVQSSTSKKITVANLFGDVDTPAVFTDKIQIQDTESFTAASGSLSITTNISYLSNPTANGNLTLANGVDGQIKIIIMTSNTSNYSQTLGGSNVEGTVQFDEAGDSATMIYTNSKWYMIGGTATYT
jgi:hypothetical protein